MASCPLHSIAIEKKPIFSCLPSWDLVPAVDQVSHSIQTVGPNLHSVDPFESLDMCPISDDLLPLDEVFLESLYNLTFFWMLAQLLLSLTLIFLVSMAFLLMLVLLRLLTLPLNSK